MKNPSKATFDRIDKNPSWSPTLVCPCQNLTIPYRRFVQISPRFHQICSSDFVTSNHRWITLFSRFLFDDTYPYDGFRRFVVPQFRALASLCTIANGTVTHALSAFMSSELISEQAMSNDTVQSQIASAVAQFELSTTRAFTMTFNHVKDMVTGNRVISSSLSNWYFADTPGWVPLTNVPRSYGNGTCLCDKSPTCSAPAWIDQSVIPGFRVGCYPVESLLQSTLECLYDIECINQIIPNDTRSSIAFQPLDKALLSSTATVRSLLDTLMIDEWILNITYDQYYSACAPLYCTYSRIRRFDRVYVFTTIMGLSGGLTVVLKLVLPSIVKLGRYIAMHRKSAVRPMVASCTWSTWETISRGVSEGG